ncbi:MAG: DUF3604 domain-containing protein [Gammaproteobacteria bacterium]|jgi:hypothetical protein|nr:MAG: DUF3604 domain-containing protein [Gammaproteobacteria bacterium]
MKAPVRLLVILIATSLGVLGCSSPDEPSSQGSEGAETSAAGSAQGASAESGSGGRRFGGVQLDMPMDVVTVHPQANAARSAYFGDLHVHTDYSFDAFAFGTVATPYDAYRFAQGEAIDHPAGFPVQLRTPLDFYAVTDHAMFLGAVKAAADTSTAFSRLPHVLQLHDLNIPEKRTIETMVERVDAFRTFLPDTLNGVAEGRIDEEMVNDIARDAWADIITAAEAHYRPGEFTTFVGYEYTTSTDDRGNLHRNVIFRDSDRLPAMPFSRFHSQNPEGLWDWMDELRALGIESLAIPHNANGSNGQMFKMVDWAGDPLDDDYARQRILNEPIIELTQIKGSSETHPLLSDTDEWADFEIMPYRVGTSLLSVPHGSYAREALLNGLVLADSGLVNAYQFGFVGASDTHTGAASLEEETFFSKAGMLDSSPALRGSIPLSPDMAEIVAAAGRLRVEEIDGKPYATGSYESWGAGGLTGVWAEENTREAIYRAFRRKETFATSGPRLQVRLFAGYDLEAGGLADDAEIARAYEQGVPMGSELLAEGSEAPVFLAWALRDPNSAPLQRLQIVKGWLENGEHQERVYDVACSDGLSVDTSTHRCPDNGAGVDLSTCATTQKVGAAVLDVAWRDPGFDPGQRAFYYVRVLENPSCRWSTWDAVRAGVAPRPDLKQTLQERAWSSPIWYVPARG